MPAASRSLGRFELITEVAKSQIGALWAAQPESGGGPPLVNLRRVSLQKQTNVDRLTEAAWWALDVSHPNLAAAVDVAVTEAELGLATEYCEGEPLRSLIRLAGFKRRPIPAGVALRIALEVLGAVDHVHAQAPPPSRGKHGYVGGGLIPDSVLVGIDGVSRLLDIAVAPLLTTGSGVGRHVEVVAYRAPEELSATPPDGARVDVFSVGIMLWEMVTSKRLFAGASFEVVAKRLKQGNIPRLDNMRPAGGEAIPQLVADVVSRALQRDPKKRFSSPREMAEAIEGSELLALPEDVADFAVMLAESTLKPRRSAIERAQIASKKFAVSRPPVFERAAAAAQQAPPVGLGEPLAAPIESVQPPPLPPSVGGTEVDALPVLEDSVASIPGARPPSEKKRAVKATMLGVAPPPLGVRAEPEPEPEPLVDRSEAIIEELTKKKPKETLLGVAPPAPAPQQRRKKSIEDELIAALTEAVPEAAATPPPVQKPPPRHNPPEKPAAEAIASDVLDKPPPGLLIHTKLQEPPPPTTTAVPGESPQRSKLLWVAAGALLVGIAIAVVAGRKIKKSPAPSAESSVTVPTHAAPAVAAPKEVTEPSAQPAQDAGAPEEASEADAAVEAAAEAEDAGDADAAEDAGTAGDAGPTSDDAAKEAEKAAALKAWRNRNKKKKKKYTPSGI